MDGLCLNCHQKLATPFCGHCGQKASTHRYSLKHFMEHDVVHGVWHVDKGILKTLKDLFTRPGHSVREFLLGKRANFFNFITLLLTLVAVSTLISGYSHFSMLDVLPKDSVEEMNALQKFFTNYPKIVLIITIPLYSLLSYLWFRKAKFNYSEHLVLNSYKTAAELVINLVFVFVTVFYTNKSGVVMIYYAILYPCSFIYPIWFYYQFFSRSPYSKKGLWIRSIMVPISYLLLSIFAGMVWGIIAMMGRH